jgi:hypothetical protein
MFDERANWKARICDAEARALKKLNIIKSLSHISWGPDQETLLKIHQMTTTIRYGEAAYGSATKAIFKRLDPVHHKGVLSSGTFVICRNANLLCEAGLNTDNPPFLPIFRQC